MPSLPPPDRQSDSLDQAIPYLNRAVPTAGNAIQHSHSTMEEQRGKMMFDADIQENLVDYLIVLLDATVADNDEKYPPTATSAEDSSEATKDTMHPSDFIKRILKYGGCSACAVVIGLVYLERLKKMGVKIRLKSSNFRLLLLVSIMVGNKFADDEGYDNKEWALIGGISLRRLNRLELDFLFQINFRLHVQTEEYKEFVKNIMSCFGSAPTVATPVVHPHYDCEPTDSCPSTICPTDIRFEDIIYPQVEKGNDCQATAWQASECAASPYLETQESDLMESDMKSKSKQDGCCGVAEPDNSHRGCPPPRHTQTQLIPETMKSGQVLLDSALPIFVDALTCFLSPDSSAAGDHAQQQRDFVCA